MSRAPVYYIAPWSPGLFHSLTMQAIEDDVQYLRKCSVRNHGSNNHNHPLLTAPLDANYHLPSRLHRHFPSNSQIEAQAKNHRIQHLQRVMAYYSRPGRQFRITKAPTRNDMIVKRAAKKGTSEKRERAWKWRLNKAYLKWQIKQLVKEMGERN